MSNKFFTLICCILSLVNTVLSAGQSQTGFPYCLIKGQIVNFGKTLKDKEECTVYKCKKGKKATVETYTCLGMDETLHLEYFNWCVENECPTKESKSAKKKKDAKKETER